MTFNVGTVMRRPGDGSRLRSRLALAGLLAGTAVLYLWGLGASGWANAYYSAAAQAGSQSWQAWFFGSFDGGNAITVDKPPVALWLMGLSVRLFGLSSWSVLVPQALAGVATVWLLFLTVRRWYGDGAGLLAGAVLALTPVATLMFRFNNPDAVLVLLMVAAAYATVRAIERASAGWLALAGAFIGFGFLAKMLQALLVLPALAIAYLLGARKASWGLRIVHLLAAGGAMIVAAGWWIAIVELWPAESRPYIGGSQNNSVLELALGYNGLGRITGEEIGSVGGGRGWGETGWDRMFAGNIGGQIAWLLPAALVLTIAGIVLTKRKRRAGFVLWGGWLVVTAVVFSLMQGIFHEYYTVALAPAVGALCGMGAAVLWRLRRYWWATVLLAVTVLGTAIWSAVLLSRSPDWQPWLRPAVIGLGIVAVIGLLAGLLDQRRAPAPPDESEPEPVRQNKLVLVARRTAPVSATAGLLAVLAGPAAYAVETAATPHTGAIVTAGPPVAGGFGGRGGPILFINYAPGGPGAPAGGMAARGGGPQNNTGGGGPQVLRPGQAGTQLPPGVELAPGRRTGGPGGLLGASTPSQAMRDLLGVNAGAYTWVAATVGSNNAAGYQLALQRPVMPLGGFNGSDPAPTLAQFQELVAAKRIHYFLGGGGPGGGMFFDPSGESGAPAQPQTGGPEQSGGPQRTGGPQQMGGSRVSAEIAEWVAANFTSTTVDGVPVYDLTTPTTTRK
ncbi:ArnT family glycosyltransferase [Longispora albida]|uniref:ArnT family glycosyltransferase n=1 Tax=Longispora albida TaxID=203523 RepID=UPI00037FA82E|nr:glycosyltransferase family 39 protein [Longispora albida]